MTNPELILYSLPFVGGLIVASCEGEYAHPMDKIAITLACTLFFSLVGVIPYTGMSAYSNAMSKTYPTYRRDAEVMEMGFTQMGAHVIYKDLNNQPKMEMFKDFETVERLRKGAKLKVASYHAWCYIGGDKNEEHLEISDESGTQILK